MYKLKILAGPDRVGKSTYIKKWALGCDLVQRFGPPERTWSGLFHPYTLPRNFKGRIWWDRSYLDHLVYETTRRGAAVPPYEEVAEFHTNLAKKIDIEIILIVASWPQVVARHQIEIFSEPTSMWWAERELALRKTEHELFYRRIEIFKNYVDHLPITYHYAGQVG